ncbi:hypothetical protein QT989_00895, partial [Microcoleus sp. SVA1_B6]
SFSPSAVALVLLLPPFSSLVSLNYSNYQSVKMLAEIEVGFQQNQSAIALHIESSSELMKMCVLTAKEKLGNDFQNEEIIRDLAIHFYNEAVRKFEL